MRTEDQATAARSVKPRDLEREFEQLHRRTQIGRLRQLAQFALSMYDLPPARLTLIAHLFNTTFRVDTDTGQRYMLRIHRAGTPNVERVSAELDWLAALRRDTALEVPMPVPTRAGPLLTLASAPGVSQPHICVLFRWLPGKRLQQGLTPRHLERAGELMGHLQNHALQWGPSSAVAYTRGRVDWPIEAARHVPEPFAPEVVAAIHTLVADSLSAAEAEQVTMTLERVRAAEQALGQDTATFGLIHADLHYGNLLFERGTVKVIDFDDCGFGPMLYDPAVMLSAILDRAEYPALRAGLLRGYCRVRPMRAEHEVYLNAFIALRQVQDALWVLEWRKHAAISGDWAALARCVLAPLANFLAGNRLGLKAEQKLLPRI